MRKKIICLLALCCLGTASVAQPRYDMGKLKREQLNRGVVAIRTDDGKVAVSWRSLLNDGQDMAFNVYRNGQKLNAAPLASGGTCFIDSMPLSQGDATYEVRCSARQAPSGSFTLKADAPCGYLPVPIERPADGVTPDGRPFSYNANDASVGDMDGDGEYEIILKWDPTNARDNSHGGFTGSTVFDCYRLNGEKLWRIDLGKNIRSGAHYTPFIVYDLDGDGKAELLVRTADGTIDGRGKVIGDPNADWRSGVAEAEADGEGTRWNPYAGRILDGPEYITVFNGLTGEAMATEPFIPQRGNARDWGDDRGNRSDRFLAGVGYFDGQRASAFISRGYYTRTVVALWDWDGKRLTNRWTFDTNLPEWKDYAGQGNHNLRVADVDGDGCDEITFGSMAIDHDGRGLYNTGMGHGDALHLTVFDPSTDKLQLWDCHENKRDGSDFRDAATGKVIFQLKSSIDVGRCMAADIDPTHPGVEMWSSDSKGIRNIKGERVEPKMKPSPQEERPERNPRPSRTDRTDRNDDTALYIRGRRLPTNSAVWWDGDLLREMLDHETVSKYDWNTGRCLPLKRFEGCRFNNGTKSNPCLSGDLIGDWREEVLVRTADNSELRLYVSPIPTPHRITCLMEDIPYRLSVATENVGYNQPPHTGFYLGEP